MKDEYSFDNLFLAEPALKSDRLDFEIKSSYCNDKKTQPELKEQKCRPHMLNKPT